MEEYFFPTTQWHSIGDGVSWRPYKHWGTGVFAGEGLEIHNGDRSGCRRMIDGIWYVNSPSVVEARLYKNEIHNISAVFSYPYGIGAQEEYFWEIMPARHRDDVIIRFFGENAEVEMETYIKAMFADWPEDVQSAWPEEASRG